MTLKIRSFIASLALLSGCTPYVTYESTPLSLLPLEAPAPGQALEAPAGALLDAGFASKTKEGVTVSWKFLDQEECRTYLGRDLLAEGYLPIQWTIRNNSPDPMTFGLDHFNIPLFDPDEVAASLHVSADDRVRRWGQGGAVHLFPPLMIPGIIDGFKTLRANEKLNKDYAAKSLKEKTIEPHSSLNGVIFTGQELPHPSIELFLINATTQEKVVFSDIPFPQKEAAGAKKKKIGAGG